MLNLDSFKKRIIGIYFTHFQRSKSFQRYTQHPTPYYYGDANHGQPLLLFRLQITSSLFPTSITGRSCRSAVFTGYGNRAVRVPGTTSTGCCWREFETIKKCLRTPDSFAICLVRGKLHYQYGSKVIL